MIALFITNAINIRYLTGFSGLSQSEREAYLLITKDSQHLFTYLLYKDEAELIAKNTNIQVSFITPDTPLIKLLSQFELSELSFEPYSITYKEHEDLTKAFPQAKLVADMGTIEKQRVYKKEKELTSLQQACALTDSCFTFIQPLIKKDVTEAELAWRIERYFRENNAEISFPPIVAFNEHASVPHHIAGSSQLSANSLILFDFGAKINGYHADMTRVIFFGKPKDEWVRAYKAVLEAQQEAIAYLSTGNSGANADEAARNVLEKAGLPTYPHSLGHGVGLEIHESPRLSIYRDQLLEPGMVFSIEPGTYLSGKFGIRIEDLAIKTADGINLLSHASKDLIVL